LQSGFGNRISYFFQKYRNSVSETYPIFVYNEPEMKGYSCFILCKLRCD
jgi:hypothetical protein